MKHIYFENTCIAHRTYLIIINLLYSSPPLRGSHNVTHFSFYLVGVGAWPLIRIYVIVGPPKLEWSSRMITFNLLG
jgi:hypothetical protein